MPLATLLLVTLWACSPDSAAPQGGDTSTSGEPAQDESSQDTGDDVETRLFDLDGDGYPAGVDCDDADASSHPGATERCEDGLDNDCDGRLDCCDPDCAAEAACLEVCGDGVDNDCDGLLDCEDGECADECVTWSVQVTGGELAVSASFHSGECRQDLGGTFYDGATYGLSARSVVGRAWTGPEEEPDASCRWTVGRARFGWSHRGERVVYGATVHTGSTLVAWPVARAGVDSEACEGAVGAALPSLLGALHGRLGAPSAALPIADSSGYRIASIRSNWYPRAEVASSHLLLDTSSATTAAWCPELTRHRSSRSWLQPTLTGDIRTVAVSRAEP